MANANKSNITKRSSLSRPLTVSEGDTNFDELINTIEDVNNRVIYVGSVAELESATVKDGSQFSVGEFWPGTGVGGGVFVWESARSKADHDGGTVIDPDKLSQLGAVGVFGAYFTAAGSGTGCFVRKWAWALVATEASVSWYGALPQGAAGMDNKLPIQQAIDSMISGKLHIPAGDYRTTGKISQNKSALVVSGAGADNTVIIPTGTMQTCWEINNGSWNDVAKVYTLSGTSIGSAALEKITLSGYSIASCDGLAMARATLGCSTKDVKISGFNGVGFRTYGCWYSNHYNLILENNTENWSYGYENNDFSMFGCDFISNPANQSEKHLSWLGGTSRNINFYGCGWDGLPIVYGGRWEGIHNLNISGGYLEVYNDEVIKSADFFQFGQLLIGAVIHGVNLIAGANYTGTYLKLGVSAGVAANVVSIDGCFQVNGDTNTSVAVDTTHASNVKFGTNRFERPVTIGSANEIVPETALQAYIPATTGLGEVTVPICTIRKLLTTPVTRIRLTVLRSGNTTATQFLRIIDQNTAAILINFPMPTTLTAGDTYDLTDNSAAGFVTTTNEPSITSALTTNTVLAAYTFKVGGSQDWPDFMITVEQV